MYYVKDLNFIGLRKTNYIKGSKKDNLISFMYESNGYKEVEYDIDLQNNIKKSNNNTRPIYNDSNISLFN